MRSTTGDDRRRASRKSRASSDVWWCWTRRRSAMRRRGPRGRCRVWVAAEAAGHRAVAAPSPGWPRARDGRIQTPRTGRLATAVRLDHRRIGTAAELARCAALVDRLGRRATNGSRGVRATDLRGSRTRGVSGGCEPRIGSAWCPNDRGWFGVHSDRGVRCGGRVQALARVGPWLMKVGRTFPPSNDMLPRRATSVHPVKPCDLSPGARSNVAQTGLGRLPRVQVSAAPVPGVRPCRQPRDTSCAIASLRWSRTHR